MMLRAQDLHKSFTGPVPVEVLRGLDLTVEAGRAVAVMGPSGSGKSTLLNLLGTLDRPDRGAIHLDGLDLLSRSGDDLARIRADHIGFVFQMHHLLPQCTVIENVLLPVLALKQKGNRQEVEQRADELLDGVGLAARKEDFPARLSIGQQQRVAIVRALINRPRLVLADEPTGALDRTTAVEVTDLLVSLARTEQAALVIATHDTELAARLDRVMEIRDKTLVETTESAE